MFGILGIILVFGLVLASAFAALSARGFRPFRAVSMLWRACSPARRVAIVASLAVLAHFAGAKHDGGGGDDGGGTSTNEPPARLVGAVRPRSVPSSPPAIVPTAISEAAYSLGLVPVRVGRYETHDFSPSATASVVEEWIEHGAATDHFLRDIGVEGFPWGTNVVRRLTVCANGIVYPAPGDTATFFAPFRGELGVVPSANWPQLAEANRPSRVWSDVRADGAFVLTWQNVLLGRDEANPVSFQLQLDPDGTATFRYDLSRLASDDALTNVVSAVAANGCRLDIPLDRSLTSVVFARLTEDDRANPDRDGDGVSTADELLVYGTDPSRCDTDRDGISDFEELFVWQTDPLDANTLRADVPDGVAVVLGDLDPFEIPHGSTNTVLEHVFYTGTTNAPFAYPVATDARALLRVSAQGAGAGRVVVGDVVVPLIAASAASVAPGLLGADPTASDGAGFLVQVVRGQDVQVHVFGSASFSATYESDDFAFGTLPYFGWGGTEGYINFPNTVADIPCIHDLNARKKVVTLPVDETGDLLTCTWQGTESVEIENIPPRSAAITGRFPLRQTRDITYTLSHPSYLFGQTTYRQTVRFCPHPHAGDEDTADDPTWLESGDGAPSDGGAFESPEWWCCFWGRCGGDWDCGCQGRCGLGCGCAGSGTVGEVSAEVCAVHNLPYEQCAPLHWTDFTNAFESVEHLGGVLYIRDPPAYDRCDLVCPYGHRNCCPCPDHSTNYVGLAYKSHRLKVVDSFGRNFTRSGSSCSVWVAGTHPSAAIGDAHLAFAANGEVVRTYDHTVLGVAISAAPYATPLSMYNMLSSGLGVPMTVVTNLNDALQLTLETNVRLPGGNIRLEFLDAEGQFALWVYDYSRSKYEKILDTEGRSVIDLSLARWRKLVGCASEYDSPKTPVYITSPRRGSTTLRFRYWGVIDGFFVQDRAEQTITSVNPPLLPDYNRDGKVDGLDVDAWQAGRRLHFWSNEDTWRDDDAFAVYANGTYFQAPALPHNNVDMVVNGRNDLVNLCPFAVDLSELVEKWGTLNVFYEFLTDDPDEVRFVPVRIGWDQLGDMVRRDFRTLADDLLREAPLGCTHRGDFGREVGYVLPSAFLAWGRERAGALAVEFVSPGQRRLHVRVRWRGDGAVLFDTFVSVNVHDVHDMYRWVNLDGVCGAETDSKYETRDRVYWPDSEHADANVVFVHGYNVHPEEAWDWGQAMFKRLWWAGMDAGFTAVLWRGNESQLWVPGENCYATRNYHQNVLNAFKTASSFKTTMDTIPGSRKYYIAHSLGNMLVSAARQDWGLPYERYFMLNAAVPVEAYDPAGATAVSKHDMTPANWRSYPDFVKSSHWYELFPLGDTRHALTWKGRFCNVDKTINFYSSEDEVVANGNDSVDELLSRKFAWYNQEMKKGARLVSFFPEAGWAFGRNYLSSELIGGGPDGVLYVNRIYTPQEVAGINPFDLRAQPFFRDFSESGIFGEGGSAYLQSHDEFHWRILSHGIPAESFATGCNLVTAWSADAMSGGVEIINPGESNDQDRNIDMAKQDWKTRGEWIHSYFIQMSLFDTFGLYQKIIEFVNQ